MAEGREHPIDILAMIMKANGSEDEMYILGLGLLIRWENSVGQGALQARLAFW